MIGLSAYGFAKGNADKLLAPSDASGNICGNSDDASFANYRYLYFSDLDADNILSKSVCVTECPSEAGVTLAC